MIELKAWIKAASETKRRLGAEIKRLAVKDRLGVGASTQGARFQGSTPEQQQVMITQLLNKFTADQRDRIIKRWIRAEQARGRIQRDRVKLSREIRDMHLARMFLKGTPLNIVEDPLYTHQRDNHMMERVFDIAYTSRGDLVTPVGSNVPKGYSGSAFKQQFMVWWQQGADANGRQPQPRPPKKPYQPPVK